jgi:hypothetical protein
MKIKSFVLVLTLFFTITVSAQTGGSFDLSHSVVASGGGSNSTGGSLTLDGTVGQASAGTLSFGGPFNLHAGFWAFAASGPTASSVYLSGRVTTPDGEAIPGVRILLVDTFNNLTRTTTTNSKGNYLFDDLAVTHFYILRVRSKHYLFTPDSYTFDVTGNLEGVNFTGALQEPPQLKEPKSEAEGFISKSR